MSSFLIVVIWEIWYSLYF